MDRQLIIAVLAGEATPDQREQLDRWRMADPRNEEEYQRQAHMWALVGQLEMEDFTGIAGVPADPARPRRAAAAIPPSSSKSRSRSRRSLNAARLAILAAAGVAGIGLGIVIGSVGQSAGVPLARVTEVTTGADEMATLVLDGGTIVRLAPDSRLSLLSAGDRGVALQGRAYFSVRPGAADPFRVETSAGSVEVTGTRFDLWVQDRAMEVLVLEGSVALQSAERRLTVESDELGEVRPDQPPRVLPVEDPFGRTQWLGNFLAFQSTPLSEVSRELARRFGLRIEVADGALSTRTVTGWFRDRPPLEVISDICLAANADCTIRGDTVRMDPALIR